MKKTYYLILFIFPSILIAQDKTIQWGKVDTLIFDFSVNNKSLNASETAPFVFWTENNLYCGNSNRTLTPLIANATLPEKAKLKTVYVLKDNIYIYDRMKNLLSTYDISTHTIDSATIKSKHKNKRYMISDLGGDDVIFLNDNIFITNIELEQSEKFNKYHSIKWYKSPTIGIFEKKNHHYKLTKAIGERPDCYLSSRFLPYLSYMKFHATQSHVFHNYEADYQIYETDYKGISEIIFGERGKFDTINNMPTIPNMESGTSRRELAYRYKTTQYGDILVNETNDLVFRLYLPGISADFSEDSLQYQALTCGIEDEYENSLWALYSKDKKTCLQTYALLNGKWSLISDIPLPFFSNKILGLQNNALYLNAKPFEKKSNMIYQLSFELSSK